MKKTLFILSAAALALASCSSDETMDVNNGSAIKFRSSIDAAGRTIVNISNLNQFKVTSFGNDGQHNTNYFTDLMVSSADNGSSWTCAQTHYWPVWGLDFYAYGPELKRGTVSISNAAQTIKAFKPEAYAADQTDLVTATANGTREENETRGVALNFNHTLAAVSVMAKTSDEATTEVEISGIRLADLKTGANYTFPEVGENVFGAWTNPSTSGVMYAALNENGFYKVTPNVMPILPGSEFCVIPQKLTTYNKSTHKGARISVRARVYNVDTNGTRTLIMPSDESKYAWVYVPVNDEWEAGKRYTYILDFSKGCGLVDPDQNIPVKPGTGEETEDDPDVDPNYPGEKPYPGPDEPVLAPITFTVSVTNFVNVNGFDTDMNIK